MKKFITILFVILCWCNVWAQELKTDLDTAAYTIDLDEFLVTAQYKPTHYKSAMHKINVISKAQMDARGVTQLDQALMISPSIRFDQDLILGPKINIRGLGSSNVAILIDGIPVIGRLDGAIDLSQISTQNIERIEIVEGPLSTIYGSNATGGVINIITRKQNTSSYHLNSAHQIESLGVLNNQLKMGFDTKKFGASVHGRIFEYNQFPEDSLRLTTDLLNEDGSITTVAKYPWNPKSQWSIGGDLRYNLHQDHRLRLKYDFVNETVYDYGTVRRPRFNPYANDLTFNTVRKDWALSYDGVFNNKLFLEANLAYNDFNRSVEDNRYYLETKTIDSSLTVKDITAFNSVFSKVNAGINLGKNTDLVLGVMNTVERGQGDRILDRNQSDSSSTSAIETAFYNELKFKTLESLQISASSRLTFHSRYQLNFTPAIHLKYAINDKIIMRASAASAYRNPALKELNIEFIDVNHYIIGNPNLKPETSLDFQLNVQYEVSKNFQATVNGYKTMLRDRITLAEYESLKFRYENIDKYDVWGVQTNTQYKWKALTIANAFSLGFWATGIQNAEAPVYGTVFDMNHSLTYGIPKTGINASFNYRHVGSQPYYRLEDEVINLSKVNAQNFVDCSLQKNLFGNMVQISGGVKNLLDVQNVRISGTNVSTGTHSSNTGQRVVSQGRSYFLRLAFVLE